MILTSNPITNYEYAVTYADLGLDQCLTHQGLARMLQEAAIVASDDCGYGLKDIPEKKVCWVLSAWRLQLLSRPFWRSALTVRTWPRGMHGFQSSREFLVYHGGELCARASAVWLLMNAATGRIARITEEVRSAYDLLEESVFDTPLPTKGKSLDSARETYTGTVGRRDIDTNGHMNNVHYLDYAAEALPEEVSVLPSTIDIVFRRQLLPGTKFRCLYGVTPDGTMQVEIQSGEGKDAVHHAFVWFHE